MSDQSIAAILTCHNRRDLTLACLRSLRNQQAKTLPVHVYLVDDGSTDGTFDAVHSQFPDATLHKGSGSLFWARGMAIAEEMARNDNPAFLLWLNDDVQLDTNALTNLLKTHSHNPQAVIVGATRDPLTGAVTHGGYWKAGITPQRLRRVPESNEPQACDTFNGNCVLIPRTSYEAIGAIDGEFAHSYADIDYGMRAGQLRVPCIVSPGTVGTCSRHPKPVPPAGFRARWRFYQSPKGAPIQDQIRYLKRHGGFRWPLWVAAGTARRMLTR